MMTKRLISLLRYADNRQPSVDNRRRSQFSADDICLKTIAILIKILFKAMCV